MFNRKFSPFHVVVLLALALAAPALAVQVKKSVTELDPLLRSDPAMFSDRQVAAYDQVAPASLANPAAWSSYLPSLGPVRQVYLDLATGEPALVQGTPVPMIPGAGNSLVLADVSARLGRAVSQVDADVVGEAIDRFLDDTYDLVGVPRQELVRRGVEPVSETVWVVTYEHRPGGVPVVGSRLTYIVGHGNLILWGSEYTFVHTATVGETAPLSAGQAETAVKGYVGWDGKRDRLIAGPELVYLPMRGGPGTLAAGVRGRQHRLVYEMILRRQGVTGTWLAHVDAANGAIVQFGDVNRYDWVRGGVYPKSWADEEANRPLPLVGLSSGGFSSVEGNYTNPGAAVTGSLDGERAEIADQCGGVGFPSVISDGSGNINFGTGPPNPTGEADCATNGTGGPHNTHSARAAYYHITRTKKKGTDWLPANSWLGGSHEVRVNITDTCNAYWSPGGGFNGFFQSGFNAAIPANCTNTGEIAAIFLHEVGHGLDQNDAQGTADGGTGETYGDVLAILELHDSCMGDGFWDMQCTGYGFPCVACTGVRDQDYAQHVDGGGSPVTTPFTPANFTSSCPGGFFGAGPCGQEVHCEAYPAGGAIWDLAVRKLGPAIGAENAWYRVERDWMLAMQASTAMFNCNSTTFASDGCAATSWFSTMLAIDDDDGNLTNGTPHAAEIFDAFNDHAIACGSSGDPGNQNSSACPALAAPGLAAVPGTTDIALNWGNVANATGYLVLKNHGDCSQSYLHQAVVPEPVDGTDGDVFYTDTDVLDNQTYGYRVVALGGSGGGADNACYSDLSNCVTPAITQCPAAIASAPGLTNPVDNQVDVAWDDSGTCSGFNIYRKQGGCAAPGSFALIAPAVGASPYNDLSVSGGITYGYEIGALDPSGSFEAGRSPCSEITPTGVCNLAPTYDATGLTATNNENATCGISLAWNTGTTTCPAQSVVYNVYRGLTSGFSPGPGNLVASGLVATAYVDNDVDFGVEYFYIVRAEALSGVGPGPNGGVEDTNIFEASSSPSGPFAQLFADDIESGTVSWTTENATGVNPWTVDNSTSNSPINSWFVPDVGAVEDQRLALANAVAITSPSSSLVFWHRVQTEANWDGGVLEYSTDGGTTWFDILAGNGGGVPANAGRFLLNPYTGPLNVGGGTNPLNGRPAWHGAQGTAFTQVQVDLGDFAGESVHFRWRFGSDSSVAATGWWVDDVEVLEGSACFDLIFLDGFESGDTTAWSAAVP